MKKIFIILLFLCFHLASALGQSTYKFYHEISLPQTDAWNFVKQGDVSPSLHTGTINLSIPIYTYKDNDFTIPISLDYSSNGNMPNQRAGVTGPGWTLNAGGCITVDVKGIPDYGMNYLGIKGFMAVHDNSYYNNPSTNLYWRYMNLENNEGSGAEAPEILLCSDGPTQSTDDKWDAEPDIFHFSFLGHSGTFHLGYMGKIWVYNTDGNNLDYRVQIVEQDLTTSNQTCISQIIITTGDGYQYTFNGDMDMASVDVRNEGGLGYKRITCWHLNEIKAPNGRTVTLYYTRYSQDSYSPGCTLYRGTVTGKQYTPFPANHINYFPDGLSDEHLILKTEYRTGLLSSISVDSVATINFSYTMLPLSRSDQYYSGASSQTGSFGNCMRLSSISATSCAGRTLASTSLSYKENTNGGRWSYLDSVKVAGTGNYACNYEKWNDVEYPYPHNGTFSVDHWGYYNGKNNNNSSIVNYYPNTTLDFKKQDETLSDNNPRDPHGEWSVCGMLNRISYPTGGYSTFEYLPNSYSAVVMRKYKQNFEPVLLAMEGNAGGVCISKVSTYLSNGVKADEKTYTYADTTGSTGILLYYPRYRVSYTAKPNLLSDNVSENATYTSSGIQDYGFSDIEYRNVTEHRLDGSRVKYCFTNSSTSDDYMDQLYINAGSKEKFLWNDGTISDWEIVSTDSYPPVHMAVSPISSHQAHRGKLLEKKVYKTDSSNTPIFKEQNTYLPWGGYVSLPCYLIRRFGTYAVYIDNYNIASSSTTQYSNLNRMGITTAKQYSYSTSGQMVTVKELESNGDSLMTKYIYVTDLPQDSISSNTVYSAMKNLNIRQLPLSEKIYVKHFGETSWSLTDGRVCRYVLVGDSMIKPGVINRFDVKKNEWYVEQTCSSYDHLGNLLESTDRNGIKTSYLWGYGGVQLVCKAENTGIVQIKAISGLQNISTVALSGCLTESQKAALRTSCPNGLFTFLEYIPGVGVSKITDTSGKETSYTYTTWGKLKTATEMEKGRMTAKHEYSNDN